MREAKLDVAHNVGVFNRLVARDPVHDGLVVGVVLHAGRLADVVAGGEELVVPVGQDEQALAGKGGAVVDDAAGLGEQRGAVVVEDLVADGLLADLVDAAGVGDGPGSLGLPVVVDGRLLGGAERSALGVETVAERVLGGSDGSLGGHGVALDDGVVGAVDLGVNTEREDVLMVVGIDLRSNLSAIRGGSLAGVHAIGVEHASQLHLELVGAVQRKGVVETILVVGSCDDLRDDELAVTGRDDGSISIVSVLIEKAVVFLVDANGVLDHCRLAGAGGHDCVQIGYHTLAVTSQLEGVGHETGTILTDIESVLLVMGSLGVSVGDDHLDNTNAVEEGTLAALVLVLETDVGEDDALAVVEANVHLVAGPEDLVAAEAERDTLGLGDADGLQLAVNVVILDELGKVVVLLKRDLGSLAVDAADVDGEDLLGLGIDDDGKVERVSILVVKRAVAEVGETLLETTLVSPAVVNTDGPGVEEDLGHVSDADFATGLDDSGVSPSHALRDVEILERQGRANVGDILPVFDLAGCQVGNDLGDATLRGLLNHNGKGPALRTGALAGAEGVVLSLGGLAESKAIELESLGTGIIFDELAGNAYLFNR